MLIKDLGSKRKIPTFSDASPSTSPVLHPCLSSLLNCYFLIVCHYEADYNDLYNPTVVAGFKYL